MVEFLTSGTFRRIVVFLLGLVVVALNKKFGLELSAEELGGVVVMVVAQIVQSSVKEAAIAKTDALLPAINAVKADSKPAEEAAAAPK